MDPATSRAFALRLEQETFESPKRDALLRDIRAGVYRSGGTLTEPFVSLRLALICLEAPQPLLDYLESLRPPPTASPAEVDIEVPAAALAAAAAWQPPSADRENELLATAVDFAVSQLVPTDSHFMRALEAEHAATTQ